MNAKEKKKSVMNKMSTFKIKKGFFSHLQLNMCNVAEGIEIRFALTPLASAP